MGWFSWLPGMSEKKEEKPPEALVLGAILRCPYGSHDSYLYLDTSGTTVNNLPKASVEDYKALFNIQPFGYCIEGGFCKDSMSFDKKWENPEPQREKINGKEIITTKSLLSCRTCGMEFKIINSGQDGINAEHILLMEEMDKNYPGLRILLDNTNGSLYLNKGMYNTAIRFIEDRMNLNGGVITIPTLFNKNNLEGAYIRGALGRLIMECDTVSAETLSNGIQNTFSNNDEVGNNEINSLIINKEMINQLRIVCKDVDKEIATDPAKRWQEKNKLSLSVAAEVVSNFTYGVIIYYSSIGNVNNKQNTGEKSAIEKKNTEGSGTEGAGKNLKNSQSTTKPEQVHHYATDKSKTYTQSFKDITDKYELNLDADWNKELLPHQGRHPNAYHDFVLDEMKNIDNVAQGNKDIFLDLYESEIKSIVRENPDMLYSKYWKNLKE